jgi:phospholipase/carboxylesterase
VTEDNRPARVAEALPALADWLRQTQARLGVGPAATAIFGFSQGAIMALELVQVHDGLAGRVLSFSGRYAALPEVAPALTTLHFLHGEADPVIPVQHARDAIERLADLQGDATIDIAEGVGHEINGHLLQCALHRLTSHIPHRTWAEALGAAPARPVPASLPRMPTTTAVRPEPRDPELPAMLFLISPAKTLDYETPVPPRSLPWPPGPASSRKRPP